MVNNPPANAEDTRDVGLNSGSGMLPGVGNDNPLQYSSLENFMDKGSHGIAKSQIPLSDWVNEISGLEFLKPLST